jgi:hypothetical protein
LVPICPSSELGVESAWFLRERRAADLHSGCAIHPSSNGISGQLTGPLLQFSAAPDPSLCGLMVVCQL